MKSEASAQPWAIPRKHPRVPLVTQVESRASRATSLGRTQNISAGGLFVLSRDTFEPNTEVLIRLSLPSSRFIEVEGVVVHTQPEVHMGIQFLEMEDGDRKAIEEFVQQACE